MGEIVEGIDRSSEDASSLTISIIVGPSSSPSLLVPNPSPSTEEAEWNDGGEEEEWNDGGEEEEWNDGQEEEEEDADASSSNGDGDGDGDDDDSSERLSSSPSLEELKESDESPLDTGRVTGVWSCTGMLFAVVAVVVVAVLRRRVEKHNGS